MTSVPQIELIVLWASCIILIGTNFLLIWALRRSNEMLQMSKSLITGLNIEYSKLLNEVSRLRAILEAGLKENGRFTAEEIEEILFGKMTSILRGSR